MQWTPEHVQWAEQHFDITSSHKAEGYRTQRVAIASAAAASGYQYSWANDDISALTASNLLKKYAQKYSGLLDMPLVYPETPAVLATAPNGLTNGRKLEVEAWVEPGGVYPMGCDVGVSAGKGGVVTSDVSGGALCSSPGAEPSFPSQSLASQEAYPSPSQSLATQEAYPPPSQSLAPQEAYPPPTAAYAPYLHPSSSGGYTTHPSPLLQGAPAPPPASPPPLLPGYSYTPSPYAPVAPGYSSPPPPPPPPPPSSYLPAAIAAPTPLAPYYAPPTPITPSPLNGCSSGPLKRKAFYLGGQVNVGGQGENYMEFGYAAPPPSSSSSASLSPLYRFPRSTAAAANATANAIANANVNGTFKADIQVSPCEDPQGADFGGDLRLPGFGGSSKTPHSATGESAFGFGSPTTTANTTQATNSSPVTSSSSCASSSCSSVAAEESLKGVCPRVLELVSSRVLTQLPPLEWGEVAGLEGAKEALEEEVLWPLLRPDVFGTAGGAPPLPRALLLYGPPGCGRTLLARCLAGHVGAPLLHLRCPLLVGEWAREAEQVLQTSFLLARARQPCVLLLSGVEAVLCGEAQSGTSSSSSSSARVRRELQAQLDRLLLGRGGAGTGTEPPPQVLLLATATRPGELDQAAVLRYFPRRVLVPPPDGPSRRRILAQNLAALGCPLGAEELGVLARRTEGYSARALARLCQDALQGATESHELPLSDMTHTHAHTHAHTHTRVHTHAHMQPLTHQHLESALHRSQPDVAHTDMDTYVEWSKMLGCKQ
ncbi:hypothetical protein ACEWY4_016918 [Coilia grayii]|uniref:AAA+ ATPase domain-containing protein n=1 Tax=Coilia grayii TaxID=363190 RepID=A0ABD1JN55_9TELE